MQPPTEVPVQEIQESLRQLESTILTTTNISKDLEAEILHLQKLMHRIGQDPKEAASSRDHFADTLIRSQDVIRSVTGTTKEFAETTSHVAQEMTRIATASENIAHTFHELKSTSSEISRFVTIVQEVASRTKMLALNARLEAERAGEFGRGFSVVADEVKLLSAESRKSSDSVAGAVGEFASMLEEFEHNLQEQMHSLNEEQKKLSAAGAMADKVANDIGNMVLAINKMERILSSLEYLSTVENTLEQARISSENLRQHLQRSLELHSKLVHSTLGEEAGALPGDFMQELYQAIVNENYHRSIGLVREALASGTTGNDLLGMLANTCERIMYEQKQRRLTLSEIFINGTIIEDILKEVIPVAEQENSARTHKGTIILGNAYGDYHSLGRKMVGVVLKAAGYDVVDLGMSVPNEQFIQAALEHDARLIGISALLLHTAVEVPKLRKQLDSMGHHDIKIMIGGAPFLIDEQLNEKIGADYVARTAAEGVDMANYIFGSMDEKAGVQ